MPLPKLSTIIALAILPLGFWYSARQAPATEEAAVPTPEHGQNRQWGERLYDEAFDVGAGGALRVGLGDGDVVIQSGNGNTVRVEAFVRARDRDWGEDVFARMNFRARRDGNTVLVDADDPRVRRDEWRRHRSFSLTARITVPRRFQVDVETIDGDIAIEDLEGDLTLRSVDGDIQVGDVRGNQVTLSSSDGDIWIDGVSATRSMIRTSDGDINIRAISGAIEARTSDGDIDVTVTGTAADATFSTSDGDITIYAPTDLRAEVILEGEELVVSRGFGLRGDLSRRRIRGTLNGGGPRVEARTRDGDVTLLVARR